MINIAKISMSVYFECKMIRNINALQVSNGKSLVMVNLKCRGNFLLNI